MAAPSIAHLPDLSCAPAEGADLTAVDAATMPLPTRTPSAHDGLIAPITRLLTQHLPARVLSGLHPGLFAPGIAAVLHLTLPARPRLGQVRPVMRDLCKQEDTPSHLSRLSVLAGRHPSLAAQAAVADLKGGGHALVFQRGSDLLIGINPTLRTLTPIFALPGFVATELLNGSEAQVTLEPGAAHLRLQPRSWAVIQLFPRLDRCG